MDKNLEEMSAKDFIELASSSIDEGRSHWKVHEEINRRIMELESLKTDMAMMTIAIADLEEQNEKLENTIHGWGLN
jgi:hypothetical protein